MATCSFVLRNVMCPVHHCNIFGDSVNHHALDLRWVCLCGRGRCCHLRGTVILCTPSWYRPEEHSFGVFGLTYSYDGMELMAS